MKLLRGFEEPSAYRGGFVAIGNFDGVHRGHQSMISALTRRARETGAPAVVLTFHPHPIELLQPAKAPPSLSTLSWKAQLLARFGVDCTIAYPTTREFLELTPEDFFEQIVRHELEARGMVEGPNFFFGRNRAGNIRVLRDLCDAAGLSLEVVPPVEVDGRMVSSSAIRSLIAAGDMNAAVQLLGHPYRLQGTVVHGDRRGALLGFPTANLERIRTLVPGDGVYAGTAHVYGTSYPAAVHIGPNLTFGDEHRRVEAHLIGYSGNLYGHDLPIDFLGRIRPTAAFANADELVAQLHQDIEAARALAKV